MVASLQLQLRAAATTTAGAADMRLLAAGMRNATCLLAADMRFQLTIHHPHEFRNVPGMDVTKNVYFIFIFINIYRQWHAHN